jgi:hypothetical protein
VISILQHKFLNKKFALIVEGKLRYHYLPVMKAGNRGKKIPDLIYLVLALIFKKVDTAPHLGVQNIK